MNQSHQDERPLESWKEIAAYLQRDAKTARNWEKMEGLPVHRHSHKMRSSVYAYASEIDAWRAGRRVVAEVPLLHPRWRPMALGATTLLCVMMVGNGIRPQVASAQPEGGQRTARQIWESRPDQAPPAPSPVSPDGRFVAFVGWNTGDLWVRDLPSGTNRRLTSYGTSPQWWQYVDSVSISQDSRQIAYSWSIDKQLTTELRVIPASGGTPRTLRRGEPNEYVTPLGWTPDNQWILISRNPPDNTTQLAMVSIRDGSLRPLKSFGWQDVNASLSPDGRWVAYDAHASEKTLSHDLFVLTADGSRESVVVQNPADDTHPVWTPDGQRILFLSDRTGQLSLWSVPFSRGKTGSPELLKPDIGRILWMQMAQDGTLYYNVPGLRSKFNIYAAEFGPGEKISNPPVLAVESFVNGNDSGLVSPDGAYLAYRSLRTGSKPALVVKTLQTGEERLVPLTSPLGDAFGLFGWFPDQRSVLVRHRGPAGPGIEFYRVDLQSGKAEFLHRTRAGIRSERLSPDGRFIIYTENNDAETSPKFTTRLVRFDLDTRRETELKKGELYMGVGISPDSRQISYLMVIQGTPASSLAVMPASGGPAREIYRASPWGNYDRFVSQVWTPDQKYVIVVRQGDGFGAPSALWKVPVAGGAAGQVGISMKARLPFLSLTADGKRLFVSATDQGPNELWALENFLPKAPAEAVAR